MLHTKHAWRGPARPQLSWSANLVGVVSFLQAFDICGDPFFLKASPSAAVNVWTRPCYKPHLV